MSPSLDDMSPSWVKDSKLVEDLVELRSRVENQKKTHHRQYLALEFAHMMGLWNRFSVFD